MDMASPNVLIASCSEYDPKELVKQILDVETLPDAVPLLEDIQGYPWHIDTKYYTADTQLCTAPARTIGDQDFADSVQAIILCFDTTKESSFQLMGSWMTFVKHMEPPVQLLVCKTSKHSDAVPRLRVQKWCLDQGFELIELEPEEDSDSEEDEFAESNGVKRIVQALHAHTWPNLTLKDKPLYRSPYFEKIMIEEAAANRKVSDAPAASEESASETLGEGSEEGVPSGPAAAGDSAASSSLPPLAPSSKTTQQEKKEREKAKTEKIDTLLGNEDLSVFAALGNDDPGDETFEQLFEKMRVMKEKADCLPPSERKAYAEQVAISFWKAIGGDADEIGGLMDSDEEDGRS